MFELSSLWLLLPISTWLAVIGGVVWAIRLEGRVNVQDALLVLREDHLKERHLDTQGRLNRIETSVVAINTKLDQLPRILNGKT